MSDARRIVLVTGARKGIGRSLAEKFLAQGDFVIGCSRQPFEGETAGYEHHCLDVSDEQAVTELFHHIRTKHGRLDILINNAAIGLMNHSLLSPISAVRQLFDTNVIGTFLFSQEAAKLMMPTRRGRIVNFSSIVVPLSLEGEAAYAASKSAIETLTKTMSLELASYGITVNAIGPTPVATDLISGVTQKQIQKILDRQGIKRLAKMEDIYNVVHFFVSDESDFVTGQVVYLGGVS